MYSNIAKNAIFAKIATFKVLYLRQFFICPKILKIDDSTWSRKWAKFEKEMLSFLRLWSNLVITKPSYEPCWKVLEKTKNFFFCESNKTLNSLFDKYFKIGKQQLKIGHFSTFEWPYVGF